MQGGVCRLPVRLTDLAVAGQHAPEGGPTLERNLTLDLSGRLVIFEKTRPFKKRIQQNRVRFLTFGMDRASDTITP